MLVKLTYFKTTGKYYSEGAYPTDKKHLFEVWDEVRKLQQEKCLPGLIPGGSEFHILVDVPEHPNRHPRLILSGEVC